MSFTCPICLAEKVVVYRPTPADDHETAEDNDVQTSSVDQNGSPIFELSTCKHKFCAFCIRAYIRSKLLDGVTNIPCCHYVLSDDEDDFHLCNVQMSEDDIHKLIHMNNVKCDGSNNMDDWCCGKDVLGSNCKTKGGGSNNPGNQSGDNELWTKYQQLKFDSRNGKDSVRRCPR